MMRGKNERRDSGSLTARAAAFAVVAAIVAVLGFGATPAGAQEDDPGDLGIGMEVFDAGCASCHQLDGSGSAAGRSLIDVALEQPDRSVHVASVTNGIGNMPGYEDRLTEDEIDAVVSYVRLTFLSEDDPMDELPRTGFAGWLLVVGLAMVGAGGLVVSGVESHLRARAGLVRTAD